MFSSSTAQPATPRKTGFPGPRREFEARGHTVIVPQFPTPEGQSVAAWMASLDVYRPQINSNTILIGHSLGGLFMLRLLESLGAPVAASVFVGAPIGVRPLSNYDRDSEFSQGFEFDWAKIRQNAGRVIVFHSDNDPYVSLSNGQELARELGVELTFVPGAGHFSTRTGGYTEFPLLLEKLDQEILNER